MKIQLKYLPFVLEYVKSCVVSLKYRCLKFLRPNRFLPCARLIIILKKNKEKKKYSYKLS